MTKPTNYAGAKEQYAQYGVDTDLALQQLAAISISLHCWQGDDVTGFEPKSQELSGGLAVTGNYPGKPRNIDEFRKDIEKVFSLLAGRHRLNLHAIYGEFGSKPADRDAIEPAHFQGWMDWAKSQKVNLDFNATCFSHPLAGTGYTLSSTDDGIRRFWINHVDRCRIITEWMGKQQNSPSVHNLWIPDGSKDITVNRALHRQLLKESLDAIYENKLDHRFIRDSVESKLFGIGSESFVAGSHEFYLIYALSNNLMYCVDMGHFHPTESVADKISSLLLFSQGIMLHISRGIRWDSDHVVIFNDDLRDLALEIVRCNGLGKVYIGLDYFDASINRVGAWVTGATAVLKAFLYALLEPVAILREYEANGNNYARLALLEEMKSLAFSAVWQHYCQQNNIPTGQALINEVLAYERTVISKRG